MNKIIKYLALSFIMPFNALAIECDYKQKCPKDLKQVYSQAINGSEPAQRLLGYLYRDGVAAKKKLAKSYQWFEQAARQHDPSAATLHELGISYLFGYGIKAREYKGAELLQKAALKNFIPSQLFLASEYLIGKRLEKDNEKARYWYTQAAKLGDLKAIYINSVLSAKGIGGEQNSNDAIALLKLAADWNYKNSKLLVNESKGNSTKLINLLNTIDEKEISQLVAKEVKQTTNFYLTEELYLNHKMIIFVENNQKELDKINRLKKTTRGILVNTEFPNHIERNKVLARHRYPVENFENLNHKHSN